MKKDLPTRKPSAMSWADLKGASHHAVVAWAEAQAWCGAMSACPQDRHWHAEGNVWDHSRRVVSQLRQLPEWAALSPRERCVLTFTAVLHDVGKPATTQRDSATGRLISPRHAVIGEQLARGILRNLGCDLATREQIAKLVRWHGSPVFLLERSEPSHEVVRHSWWVQNRLLYLFALADARGREVASQARSEDPLHLWKMQAEELECFDEPYRFVNDHSRFLFFRRAEPNLYEQPREAFSCCVTLIAGLPGSGKDTWLAKQAPHLPVVSLDGVRKRLRISPAVNQGAVIQAARERCRQLLRAQQDFALNATNLTRRTRARWIDLFASYGARVCVVYLEPPLEQILQRNKRRERVVRESVIRKLQQKCEPPTWDECHQLVLSDE